MLYSIGILSKTFFQYLPHQHAAWEFIYYISGSGELTIGGDTYPFAEGDLYVMPPSINHSELSPGGYQNIHMQIEAIPRALMGVRYARDSSTNDMRALLMMIYRNFFWKDVPNQAILDSLLDALYQYILALGGAGKRNEYVEQICAILISNLSNADFNMDEMYQSLHLNEDYARRVFRREMKCSPLVYLTRLRMRHACSILSARRDTISIREVCELVGVKDAYYFSRLFKSYMGVSPQAWVKRQTTGPLAIRSGNDGASAPQSQYDSLAGP